MANSMAKLHWRFELKLLKKFHWFELLLITIVMGVHFYVAISASHNFASHWFTRDDSYYYFKVAQNISEGYGSSFDRINLTNGYHPLWMIICIPLFSLARFDLILPLRVLVMVMALFSTTTSILLFRLLKKQTGLPIAIASASFWAFSQTIHSIITQQGMETGLVAFSTVLFLIQIQKSESKEIIKITDFIILGMTALLVLFSRLDMIFFIIIAGIWLVFRGTPIRYLLSLDLMITLFVIVGAFIQRASLKMYLLAYDLSAVYFAVIIFFIQSIIFYFTGLYSHPSQFSKIRLFILTIFGITISTLISIIVMYMMSASHLFQIPRAIPVWYWVGMVISVYGARLIIKYISPWPLQLSKQNRPYQGILSDMKHVKIAFDPIIQWSKGASVYFGIISSGLLIYMLLNKVLFGTLMPVSGQIKRWWGSMPNDVYGGPANSILDVYGIDPKYSQSWALLLKPIYTLSKSLAKIRGISQYWYWAIIFLIVIVFFYAFFKNRKKNLRKTYSLGIFPLLLGSIIHSFSFGATAYSAKHEWYWVIQMLSIVILCAVAISNIVDILPRKNVVKILQYSISAIISIYLASSFGYKLITKMPFTDLNIGQPYMDTLPILENNTEAGALIGMTGGGNTGYFIKNRTIVNMDGLINSYDYFNALKNNKGGVYMKNIGLDYIFANRYIITSSMPYRYQFSSDDLITVIEAPAYGNKILMRFTQK